MRVGILALFPDLGLQGYLYIFLKTYILLIMLLTVVPLFSPLPASTGYPILSSNTVLSPHPLLPPPLHCLVHVHGSCIFFGYSITYTVPNISSTCLFCTSPLCFLIPATFPSFSPFPCKLVTLHMNSKSIILFLFCLCT